MRLDIFNHFLPPAYIDAIERADPGSPLIRYARKIKPLWDMDARLAALARFPDVKQVVALGQPTPELVAGPDQSPEFARLANDGMAAIRDRWPERFPAFVASLPMNNVDASLAEMDRAVGQLGARGIQVLTNVNGRPLDEAAFFPIFERIANRYDLPVWMHPFKPQTIPDYPGEAISDFDIWVVLGWPHESAVAMARLVFAEMFDRLPKLRVITHHCGATIPMLAGRIGPIFDELGERTENARERAIRARMAAKGLRPIDYFKRFYADSVLGGSTAALACGLDFFGPDQVVFATDYPYGPEQGMWFLRENLRMVDELPMASSTRDGIYFRNALKLMGLPAAAG